MDIETLISQLPSLRGEAARLREEEALARRRAENLERIIEGVEGLMDRTTVSAGSEVAPTETHTPGDGPRGIAAVRRVMLEHPARIWKAKEIHAELERQGWISPAAQHPLRGTEAAINRLWKRGEVDRVDAGRYRTTDQMRRATGED